jgi:hypothetical protein
MTSGFTGPEILLMVATALLLGGGMGAVTGSIISKGLSQFKQPLKAYVLLGIVGYWAGAYISGVIWRLATGNGEAVKIYLLAAIVGSATVTVLGSIGISGLRRMLHQQARSDG